MTHLNRRQMLRSAGAGLATLALSPLYAVAADTAKAAASEGFTLPPLPYAYDALEPHIDAETARAILAEPQRRQRRCGHERKRRKQREDQSQDADLLPVGARDTAERPEDQLLQYILGRDELQQRDNGIARKDQRDAKQDQRFDARTAQAAGLLNYVVPAAELDTRVDWLIGRITDKSPTAIRRGKYAMRAIASMSFDESIAYTESQIALLAMTEDAKEGLKAFAEKRKPIWPGR